MADIIIKCPLTPEDDAEYHTIKALANDDVVRLAKFFQFLVFGNVPAAPAPLYLRQAWAVWMSDLMDKSFRTSALNLAKEEI